jgi:hypothetical protein
MSPKSGGAAFPTSNDPNFPDEIGGGLTKRDYFAAQAIAPLLAEANFPADGWAEYIAGAAYHLADAMLVERAK